ncbi:MAG: McrC family protein [Actinomycetota bacterium]
MRIQLTERGDPDDFALPPEAGAALAGSGLVAARPSISPGLWTVQATTYVGVAEIAGVELWIKPKVSIERLLFLLGYALDPKGWRHEDVRLQEHEELVSALAHAFERQGDRALQQGLLQGYVRIEECLPVLRGRLRAEDQLKRRFGLAVPLEISYDDFTIDIAEHQLLVAAARALLRLPRVPGPVRQGLVRLTARLDGVTTLPPGRPLPRWTPTRLNVRYHTALRLAELILSATSVEQAEGQVRVNGFMFNLEKVFEDFVTVALSEALAKYGGATRCQDTAHCLDAAGTVNIRPDLVWYEDLRPSAVVDAKYKAEKPSGFPDADLYQMLAYCTALGLRTGHLVYAKGNETAGRHVVRNSAVEIVQHALDLEHPPAALLHQVEVIARSIARSSATLVF